MKTVNQVSCKERCKQCDGFGDVWTGDTSDNLEAHDCLNCLGTGEVPVDSQPSEAMYTNKIVYLPKWNFIAKVVLEEGNDELSLLDYHDKGIAWSHLEPNGVKPSDLKILGEYPKDEHLLTRVLYPEYTKEEVDYMLNEVLVGILCTKYYEVDRNSNGIAQFVIEYIQQYKPKTK